MHNLTDYLLKVIQCPQKMEFLGHKNNRKFTMRFPNKKFLLAVIIAIFSATYSFAGGLKTSVAFEGLPKGTKCSVASETGRVKVKYKKNDITVKVKNGSLDSTFFCDLPNGKRIATNILSNAPKTTKWAAGIIRPNGAGRIYFDSNGSLVRQDLDGKHIRSIKK